MRAALIFWLYRLLQWVLLPVVALYLSVRCLRDRRYLATVSERLGFLPRSWHGTGPGDIWLHAVSVGEVMAAAPLIRDLRAALPGVGVWVSVSTLAGRALANEKLKDIASGVFYAPIDYCSCVRRVLRRLQPSLLIVCETEIWPHLWRESVRRGARLIVVNGRISDKAMPSYQRRRWFFEQLLALPDRILVQDETARLRYIALGAAPDRVVSAGNLKYDFLPRRTEIPPDLREVFNNGPALDQAPKRHIWIAASTMPPARDTDVDEDDAVIAAFQQLAPEFPDLLLILAPRKPGRFDTAAAKLAAAGVDFVRRTKIPAAGFPLTHGVLLLDSIGELSDLFAAADVVFMGGTLADRGGHNVLEPAASARPIIVGPHMENFSEIATEFLANDAVIEIRSAGGLGAAVASVLRNGDGGRGERARRLAQARRGATAKAVEEAARQFDQGLPMLPPRWWADLLGLFWAAGVSWKRRQALARARKLGVPVVSIGGISAGGAGKTPLALWLARELKGAGLRPAFLTRGYRKQSSEPVAIFPAGASAPVSATGDEAQILLQSGLGPVGIASDRYSAGIQLEQAQPARDSPDIFVLDDGFQHWRLHRDVDLVAIDVQQPFGGGRLIPAGRLRESHASLRRSSAIILTRCRPDRRYAAVLRALGQFAPGTPVFRSSNRPLGWRDLSGERAEPSGPVLAFCGLGNPGSFWSSLEDLPLTVLKREAFSDHHRYSLVELRRMAAEARSLGASCLVTTQKDVFNLPPGSAESIAPMRILWLEVETQVEDGDRLVDLVIARTVGETRSGVSGSGLRRASETTKSG